MIKECILWSGQRRFHVRQERLLKRVIGPKGADADAGYLSFVMGKAYADEVKWLVYSVMKLCNATGKSNLRVRIMYEG